MENDKKPGLFIVFEAKALRKFPGEGVKAGDTIYVSEMAPNRFYLSKQGRVGTNIQGNCFGTDSVEGVDFVRV